MPQKSNCVLILLILFFSITSLIYAMDPPTIVSVSFDVANNKIDIIVNFSGGLGSDDSCHAILVSDLSSSLSGAYEIGSVLRCKYRAAFISKLNECESECSETQVWLELANDCGYINKDI